MRSAEFLRTTPVTVMLREWGERWAGPWGRSGAPLKLIHRGHDHDLHVVLTCADCGEPVNARSAQVMPTRGAVREREAFAAEIAKSTLRRVR